VTIKVTKDDPMTRRMQEAMERMKHSFAWEIERIPDTARSWRILALRCAEILLPHRDHDARKSKPMRLVFQNGTTWVYRVEHQLEDSHKRFLVACSLSYGGITIAIGPPGSGKTTLLVNYVGMLLTQVKL
jgi:hypothetical protein